MTDPRDPQVFPDDRELLSAWLAGDLDEAQASALERRLAGEPQLAGQLDGMVELLGSLRRHDQVEPPGGYTSRLRERLQAERRRMPDPVPQDGGNLQPSLLVSGGQLPRRQPHRRAPGRRRARLHEQRARTLPAVAAVVLVLAVVAALPLLRSSPTLEVAQDQEVFALEDDASRLSGAPDIAEQVQPPVVVEDLPETLRAPAAEQDALEQEEATAEEDLAQPETGTEDLRERFGRVPEAQELLGMPVSEARGTSSAYRTMIEESPVFSTGVAPDTCLEVVTGDADERVPVRVEAFRYQDHPRLAYVVVSAPEGVTTLERIEVWVMDPRTCSTDAFVSLEHGRSPGQE